MLSGKYHPRDFPRVIRSRASRYLVWGVIDKCGVQPLLTPSMPFENFSPAWWPCGSMRLILCKQPNMGANFEGAAWSGAESPSLDWASGSSYRIEMFSVRMG